MSDLIICPRCHRVVPWLSCDFNGPYCECPQPRTFTTDSSAALAGSRPMTDEERRSYDAFAHAQMEETPRADAADCAANESGDITVLLDLARELERENAAMLAEVERLKSPKLCGVCCGEPLASGRKCICGGIGTEDAEMDGLRVALHDTERRAETAEQALAKLSKKVKGWAASLPENFHWDWLRDEMREAKEEKS
jgi:hypothetical protein